MMLHWLADRYQDEFARLAARRIEAAVDTALANGQGRTADVGGQATTDGAADAVIRALGAGL